jgi:hypothetical protein
LFANRRFEDHYDAVLYLGPTSANPRSTLTFPRCNQPDYVAKRVARIEIAGVRMRPGTPTPAERIKQACRPMPDTR